MRSALRSTLLVAGLSSMACGSSSSGPSNQTLRVMFITSASGNAQLSSWADAGGQTGLAAADAICQARATAAQLSGTFVAWLSSSTDDAYCRIHGFGGLRNANCGQTALPTGAGPWVRTDGFPFSDSLPSEAAPYSPPIYDESGAVPSGATHNMGLRLLTNTDASGAAISRTATCADWTNSGLADTIIFGSTGQTFDWNAGGTYTCNGTAMHLVCFERGSGKSLPSHVRSGKHVFVTSTLGKGKLSEWSDAGGFTGVAAGDAICQAHASAAGLVNPTTYKAWLSTSSIDAINHLSSTTGPWVRLDGVLLAENQADLLDGLLFTAITFDETGVPYDEYVYTGTDTTGVHTTSTCNDWTSNDPADSGTNGRQSFITDRWTQQNDTSCDTNARLICFEN